MIEKILEETSIYRVPYFFMSEPVRWQIKPEMARSAVFSDLMRLLIQYFRGSGLQMKTRGCPYHVLCPV
jgi:hypothetical protein